MAVSLNKGASLIPGDFDVAVSSFFFKNINARDSFFDTAGNEVFLEFGLPVIVNQGNASTVFIWTGADSPSSYDSSLFLESPIDTGPGTLFLGLDGMSLSSAARTVNLVDAYGATSIPIGTQFDATGNLPPFQYDFGVSSLQSVSDVFDTLLADPQSMQFSTVSNTMTSGYGVRPGTAGDLRVRAFAGTSDTDPIILDSTFTILVGDLGTVKEIVLSNKTLVETGDDVLLEFSGIQLNGGLQTSGVFNGQTVPYLDVDFALLTSRDLVVQGDTHEVDTSTYLDGSTQSHGATRSADDWHVAASVFKQSFSTVTQDDSPEGVFFRDDGLKMYVAGDENALIYEYDLSTSWNVSTAVFLQSFDPSITDPLGIFFRPTGLTMFVLGAVGDTVEEFVLTSAWDISTASTVQSIDLSSLGGGGLAHNLYFKPDGLTFYVIDQTTKEVEQYTMTTEWDIGTASLTTVFDTSLSTTFGLSFKLDGTVLYVGEGDGTIVEYNLTTPWLVDTAELVNTFAASGPALRGMFFKTDGSKFYIAEDSSNTIIEYNVGLAIEAPLNLKIPLNNDTVSVNFIDESDVVQGVIEYQDALARMRLSSQGSSVNFGSSLSFTADVNMIMTGDTVTATASTGDLALNSTAGQILLNSLISVGTAGQTLALTSASASGTPTIAFDDSSDLTRATITYTEADNDLTITADTGDLRLVSSSSDLELVAGSGFAGLNIGSPLSTFHMFENTASGGQTAGLTIEQDGIGDAVAHFVLTGTQDWTIGVDNSLADQFAIRPNIQLNAQAPLQILITGETGINKTPRANHCLDIDTTALTVVALYDQKDVTLEQGNNGNGNSTDFFFNRADAGFNQSEFCMYNNNDSAAAQRNFRMNFTNPGVVGGLNIHFDGSVGIGTLDNSEADTLFHILSPDDDDVAIETIEVTGANGATTQNYVTARDPHSNILAPSGSLAITVDGETSSLSLHEGSGAGSLGWRKVSTNPTSHVEITNLAKLEALATAGTITVTSQLTLIFKITVTSDIVFDIQSGGGSLTLTSVSKTGSAGYQYSGTGTLFSGDGSVNIVDMPIVGSTSTGTAFAMTGGLTTLRNTNISGFDDLGTLTDLANFTAQNVIFNQWGAGLDITDLNVCRIQNCTGPAGPGTGSLFNYITDVEDASLDVVNVANLNEGEALLNIDPRTINSNIISVTRCLIAPGVLFQVGTDADVDFSAVADGSPATTALTAMATNGAFGTTITAAGHPFVEDEIVTITGTTSYNGTFRVFNVAAGVFDIDVTFVADDATGSADSDIITLTVPVSHGIVATDNIKIVESNFYNAFYNVLSVTATTVDVNNGGFVGTDTGTIERDVSLDQTDPRVLGQLNRGFVSSKYIATCFVNDNSTANAAITNNVFTDMVFGTGTGGLAAASTMERWKMVDRLNGTMEYTGEEPFDGLITFDFTVESSGGSVDFRFKWVRDSNAVVSNSFIDFADTDPDEIFNQLDDFITAGFQADDEIDVSGSTSNDGAYTVAQVNAGKLTLVASDTLVTEAAGAAVTITALEGDLIDNVESLVNVGSNAQSVTKTFPLSVEKGDQIRPQITRNSGTSGITTRYATIYATQTI